MGDERNAQPLDDAMQSEMGENSGEAYAKEQSPIEQLPLDVLKEIAGYLPNPDLVQWDLASKQCYAFLNQNNGFLRRRKIEKLHRHIVRAEKKS